ncbi:MAG: hypothetical protein OXN86_08300 [Chloroflexota bacterium]|nr:hypothetical protein [Chloroflexota bacterium]
MTTPHIAELCLSSLNHRPLDHRVTGRFHSGHQQIPRETAIDLQSRDFFDDQADVPQLSLDP